MGLLGFLRAILKQGLDALDVCVCLFADTKAISPVIEGPKYQQSRNGRQGNPEIWKF